VPFGDVSLVLDVRGLSDSVEDISFCPNGTMLAACSQQEVRVWDTRTGQPLRTLRGEIGPNGYGNCLSVAFSHDNCELVVGIQAEGAKGALRVYDIRNIAEIDRVIDGFSAPVTDVAFSRDGRFLAIACADASLTIYDWSLRQVVGRSAAGTHPPGTIEKISFPLDEPLLLAYGLDQTTILSIPGCETLTQESELPPRLANWLTELPNVQRSFGREFDSCDWRFDQDVWAAYGSAKVGGQQTYWAGCWRGTEAAPQIVYSGHDQEITAIAFSGDCALAATGDRHGQVHVWDTQSGDAIYVLKGIAQPVYRAALDAESRRVGFTHEPLPPGQFQWNKYGEIDRVFDFDYRTVWPATADGFLPGERTSRGGHLSATFSNGEYGLRFQWPRGGSNQFKLANAATPTCFSLLQSERHGLDYPAIIGDKLGGLALVDPGSGRRQIEYVGHRSFITSLCESADGRCFTSSSRDGTIRLWNLVATGPTVEPVLSLFVGTGGEWIVWTPQGFYDAAPGCGDLAGWHVNRGANRSALFYPLHQFRDQLYRPDIIQSVLQSASVETAIEEASQIEVGPARPIAPDAPKPMATQLPLTTDFRKPQTMQQMHPPRIRVVSPQDGTVVNEGHIHVLAEIAAENDLPITDVRILVNGRPGLGKGIAVLSGEQSEPGRVSFSRAVPLLPGENQITLLAGNGVAHSNPVTIQVRYDAPNEVLDAKPNLHLLSVGISEYKDPQFNLRYAHLDAETFAAAWDSQRGPVYEQLTTSLLTNSEATGDRIQLAMSQLAENVNQRDVAVIFISAHGIRDRQLEYYLAPHEVNPDNLPETGLHFSMIAQLLESLPCKVLLFVDTCHAAGITGAKSIWRDPLYELTSEEYGAIVFASSLSKEISVEDEKWGHGAFTKAILSTFADHAADLNEDGFLSLTEFEQSVGDRVAEMTKGQQHPVMKRPATIHNIPFYRIAVP
jgi:WD40 repeat protein